jgi:anti-anti-sigma regulatory factor
VAFPPIPPFGPSMVSSLFAKRMSFPEGEHDIFTIINHFHLIFDHLPMKVVLTEVIDQTTFHYVPINRLNQSFEPLDIEGNILHELFPEAALERVHELYRSCLSTQSMLEAELELLDAQGKPSQWILCFVVPLFNDQMTVTHILLIAYDISLRKQRELAEQREKIAQLEQLADDLLVRSVPILMINPQTVLLPLIGSFDPDREALIAQRLQAFVSDEAIRHVIIDLTGLDTGEGQVQTTLAQLCAFAQRHALTLIISGVQATAPYLSQLSYDPEWVQLSDSLQAALRLVKQQLV